MSDPRSQVATADVLPTALRLDSGSRALELDWSDGSSRSLSFRVLRERCRCAECRSLAQRGREIAAVADVGVIEAVPYGPNAVQLVFSDGHSRGIFPFAYLRELALEAQPAL